MKIVTKCTCGRKIEILDVKEGDIINIPGKVEKSMVSPLLSFLNKKKVKCLLLIGVDLDIVDEKEMNAKGWYRKSNEQAV